MFDEIIGFIRGLYNTTGVIPLHEPKFTGNEKAYINECIDTGFVSSVGKFVDQVEEMLADYTGAAYAVATVNGTTALHTALVLAGVENNCEVITQPLTFIATCNAISYCGAKPIFVDVDMDTLGMSPKSLRAFLESDAIVVDGECINQITNKSIKACVPMHTFGHPCRIDEIREICDRFKITLIEDAAESIGSFYNGKHTGTFGQIGALSFNGNKIITAGGGGAIITNDENLAKKAKHITTTAKIPHEWEYEHDVIGYNYRMPNINAALLCAQLENLDIFIENKRELAEEYEIFFNTIDGADFIVEPKIARSNYWLNAIKLRGEEDREGFLKSTNENGIKTRSIWKPMIELDMYKACQHGDMSNSIELYRRTVNIPSSVRL
jgi:perosamine synthetase